ncbi:MAG TPA: DUF3052 family protein [Candidatus Dormibacteraeota bacterium]|nr:DUF3052 family protein [Candidatus Dormibacteraeota bacterium]
MSPEFVSTRSRLEKLGVKPGAKVALVGVDDPDFLRELRQRTPDITRGRPRGACDLVFLAADTRADLTRINDVKKWIEPNGAIWIVRPKGGRSELKDTDIIQAGLDSGLVDNKIMSFSETHGATRLVYRLKDRPR